MKSILLVDDEVAIAVQLQESLQRFGYQVEAAHTFESALDAISNAHFDAILVEFNLRSERGAKPRAGNGPKLVSQLRARGITAPILMLTVMEGQLYDSASRDAGADALILKPIPIRDLVSRLRSHICRHEQDLGQSTAPQNLASDRR
jgi:DNA-binding response OmpR family regulator